LGWGFEGGVEWRRGEGVARCGPTLFVGGRGGGEETRREGDCDDEMMMG